MDDRQAVRSFLTTLLRKSGDAGDFTDTESLVISGRLSSLDVLEIVSFLEKRYGLDFGDRPFDQQSVDSMQEILCLITETTLQS